MTDNEHPPVGESDSRKRPPPNAELLFLSNVGAAIAMASFAYLGHGWLLAGVAAYLVTINGAAWWLTRAQRRRDFDRTERQW